MAVLARRVRELNEENPKQQYKVLLIAHQGKAVQNVTEEKYGMAEFRVRSHIAECRPS